jgi:hypothetical protein
MITSSDFVPSSSTEADLVMGGSVAGDYIGQSVASPLVTLIDYANTYNSETCPVPVYVDDEGTKSEDVIIIKNGILQSFMHNKDSARHFDKDPTGIHCFLPHIPPLDHAISEEIISTVLSTSNATPEIVVSLMARPKVPFFILYPMVMAKVNSLVESA